MTNTALSDLVSALADTADERIVGEFYSVFMRSSMGIEAANLSPHLAPGTTFQIGANDRVSLRLVQTPDGRRMVKACADPEVFSARYPETKITAVMLGTHLLEMVLKSQDLDGVLVCSAVTFHSVPITREEAGRLLDVESSPSPPRP